MATRIMLFGAAVCDIISGCEFLGGAPLNTAAHLAKFGIESAIISKVGQDRFGEMIIEKTKQLGVNTAYIQIDADHPTGTAICSLDNQGSAEYTINDDAAYNYIECPASLMEDLNNTHYAAFYFGIFEQRGAISSRSLKMIIERIKCNCIFCDLNIRLDFHPDDVLKFALTKSNIVKMNDVEADIISRQLYGSYENDENISRRISHDYNIDVVCITKGSMGYSVYYQNEYKTCEAVKTQVRDTIGAGDAFSAAFLAHYCQTKDPLSSCLFGNYMGSYVASQSSAIPVYSEELKEIINEFLCK